MNVLTLEQRVEISPRDILEPGEYISSDMVSHQLLLMTGGGKMEALTGMRPWSKAPLESGALDEKRILFQRIGGFGDLILLTPVLREVKRRWPTCHVGVSCMSHYSVVLAGLPFVDEILPFPVLKSVADTYDAWVFYENAIEKNPLAEELHMTDLFARIAGIDKIENLLPEYRVKPTEAIWANEAYPRFNGTRRATVQVGTSGRCRRYPLIGDVCAMLTNLGWEVMLLGVPGEVPELKGKRLPAGLVNLTESGLTFRQSCAVMNTSDCFIGSDSAILHVAGALAIPAVGLYGPFPYKLRTAYAPTTYSFQGVGKCAPCFHHELGTMRNPFPEHCPSKAKGLCEVLASIKPDGVVSKVLQIARTIEPMGDVVAFAPERN